MRVDLTYRLLWLSVLVIGIIAGVFFAVSGFSGAGLMAVLGTVVLGLTLVVAGNR